MFPICSNAKRFVILFALIFVQIQSAQILPVEEGYRIFEKDEKISFSAIKDVNQSLKKYEGKWSVALDDAIFILNIYKITTLLANKEIDDLKVEYDILDESGNYIEKHICQPNDMCGDDGIFKHGNFTEDGWYKLFFTGLKDGKCNSQGFVEIKVSENNLNELKFRFYTDHMTREWGCEIQQGNRLPVGKVTFTKSQRY